MLGDEFIFSGVEIQDLNLPVLLVEIVTLYVGILIVVIRPLMVNVQSSMFNEIYIRWLLQQGPTSSQSEQRS